MEHNENTEITKIETNEDRLYLNTVDLIQYARGLAAKQVNFIQLMTYYSIGRWIVEEQQEGNSRAKYGQNIINNLSKKLLNEFGRGFSGDTLKNARKFYLIYRERISETVFSLFAIEKSEAVLNLLNNNMSLQLSWSHYLQLMRIENADERSFYEIEAVKSNWSVRTLQRQYNSSLYERLALSRDKSEVMRLSEEGNVITKPQDIVKQPTVLEFLGLEEKAKYVESDLETAIIDKLQKFLLEMGKGYLFEARQKRFTFNEDDFYVDLVTYNRLLHCYVLIDLKVDKLTHQDIGQMQMYVNYYDRYEKLDAENPTIGILLCKEKNDALVEITLPKDANIYASEYKLYLPDKKVLQNKLREWIDEERGDEDIQ
ncbi:PDDEXK nuclease domain-containing protein [Anaerosporobacter sp.]|uniref:PDDEXK nuclease domain-containing protein n=1 Tax=Anaerosporobacter sp. TaxID=1872529 RepID=UPI00286F3D31|nr:PDDEXK nuclease domain-containing protein [Anaerosporobacter sp.]